MLSLFAQTYTTVESSGYGFGAPEAGLLLVGLVIWVLFVIALWKVFEKAGIPGWKAIIPIYNSWLLMEMAGKPGWWALVGVAGVIPVLGFIASIIAFVLYVIAALELGKAFGKTPVFSVFGLVIFNIVGFMILGFGKDTYTKPATAPAQFA